MATRFYLGTGDVAPDGGAIAPTFDASWEQTTSAVRARMVPFKRNSAFANLAIAETSTSGTFDFLFRQYISDPLNAVTVTGTVKGVIRCLESATDADFRAQMLIKVMSRDGSTTTGTLLSHDASGLTSEFDATTLTNRKFPLAWAGAGTALGSVAAAQGDRLVIEIGIRSHNVTASSRTGTLRFGEASASDLAEDETSTTDNNPWIEFSQTLTFENQLTDRRGLEEPIFTELGPGVAPHGGGISYATRNMPDGTHGVPFYSATRRASGNTLFTRLGANLGIPVGRAESYMFRNLNDVTHGTNGTDITGRRPPGGGANTQPQSASTTFAFKMRARANPGPGYVTWVVFTDPDFAGAQAPAAIIPGTVVVSDSWES